ncbi:hypothetical protein [Paenibacillus swuensis]|uniref:hypothetical protein n=1 Tax=Paenibacillus swuensis TaxID=1178515 RepID=UPI0012F953AB|nr:hypothetical protein [Paenibacillus swuensis]
MINVLRVPRRVTRFLHDGLRVKTIPVAHTGYGTAGCELQPLRIRALRVVNCTIAGYSHCGLRVATIASYSHYGLPVEVTSLPLEPSAIRTGKLPTT